MKVDIGVVQIYEQQYDWKKITTETADSDPLPKMVWFRNPVKTSKSNQQYIETVTLSDSIVSSMNL